MKEENKKNCLTRLKENIKAIFQDTYDGMYRTRFAWVYCIEANIAVIWGTLYQKQEEQEEQKKEEGKESSDEDSSEEETFDDSSDEEFFDLSKKIKDMHMDYRRLLERYVKLDKKYKKLKEGYKTIQNIMKVKK